MQIHPFADGNGRMSRMILNAILYAFMGCVAPICGAIDAVSGKVEGGDETTPEAAEAERQREYDQYIGCCMRAGNCRDAAGEYFSRRVVA